jgi:eukaryotic-like serine/threonine-protein kinase
MTARGGVLAERFEILGRVGAGGMGAVYRATDRRTGKIVAVKELHATGVEDNERFARECDFLAALDVPGVVRHVAHGLSPEGARYLVMEWVDGPTLSQELKRRSLTANESVEIAIAVSEIVAAIHARGIVHRDVKPSNIVLEGGDHRRPKLLDFGVARLEGTLGGGLTAAGLVVGSAGYLSPEQAMGRPDVDSRADVFAIGCLLFKCLTGRVPFRGEDPLSVLLKITLEDAPRVRDFAPHLSTEIDDVVAALLSREREDRPRDAAEVHQMLTGLDLSDAEPQRASFADGAIGGAEHRLTSLVLARRQRGAESSHADSLESSVRRALEPMGLTPERYADGTQVVMVASASDPLSDIAKRAVRAATAMRDADPSLFIAVTTGRATDGRAVMVSDTVDRAASLLAHSMLHGSPGDVALDDATALLIESSFEIESSREVKRLVSERTDSRIRTVFGKHAAFVGREAEVARLRGCFQRTADESRARAALVLGPPGMGKSRLCHEVIRSLSREGVEVWVARGDPLTQSSPFGMFAPVLFDLAGITRGEGEDERWDKLDKLVEQRASGPGSRRIAEFLAEVCNVEIARAPSQSFLAAKRDVSLMGDQMRRALIELVLAVLADHPLVIALDDVQWADPSTVSFIDATLQKLADRPLFVMALARPEVSAAFPTLFAGRLLETLDLTPLADSHSASLARELCEMETSDETIGKIVRRASGNPFFVEELARAALTGSLASLPDSVLAVLEARLEALPQDARKVLRAASVFGRHFWEGGIRAMLPKVDVRALLLELETQDIIVKSSRSRFRGQAELAFRHAVHVEAAYARLPEDDRRRAHRAAARWLEEVGERDPIVLAGHFERADDAKSAVGLLAVAAHLALESSDLGEAVRLTERALSGGAFGEERGRVLATAAEAKLWLANTAEALAQAREALGLLVRGERAWCSAASVAIIASGRIGDRAGLTALASSVVDLEPELREPGPERIILLCQLAIQLLFAGELELADRALAHMPAGHAQGDPTTAAWFFRARAWRALASGDTGAYGMLMKRSAASFDQIGDVRNACVQRVNVAYAAMCLGQLEDAILGFDGVIEIALGLGLANVVAVARHNAGLVRSWLGQEQEGERDERLAMESFRTQRDDRMVGCCSSYLARILIMRGEAEQAEAVAREGQLFAHGHRPLQALLEATIAEALADRDRAAGRPPGQAALAAIARAMEMLSELGFVHEGEGYIRYVNARIALEAGDQEAARDACRHARERLDARAQRLSSEALRHTFLHRLPEHQHTLDLFERLGSD